VGSQVSYWKFDEGYGTTAYDSVGDNDGTISGATWTNDGKFGKGLDFDGVNDYVELSSLSGTDSKPSEFSVSAWAYKEGGDSYIFDDRTTTPVEGFHLSYDSFNVGDGISYVQASSTVSNNQWNYVAGVFDGNSVKFYVNGEEKDSTSFSGTYAKSSRRAVVGYHAYYSITDPLTENYGFEGKIDEVKFYNSALTAEEIKRDYNQGKSLVMGSGGTANDGVTPSDAASREYCIPGDTATCNPPVAEWKFDEMSGGYAEDTSGNGNRGTLTNGPTWEANGKIGSALSFDGSDDYVNIAYDSNLKLGNTGTISVWFKPITLDSGTHNIVSYGGSSYADGYLLNQIGNSLYVYWEGDGSSQIQLSNFFEINHWYYIVLVNNSGSMSVYRNGKLITSGISSGGTITSDFSTYIGGISSGWYINGLIDHVQIYDYARTPSQIAWDYNRGKPVGWWRMDEGEGTTVYDHSGNGNNGTMTNMDPATDWVDGKNNGALDFDGVDDGVEVPYNESLDPKSGEITISAWVNMDSGGNRFIFEKTVGGTVNTGYSLFFEGSNTTLRIHNGSTSIDLDYAGQPSIGSWHHVVGVNSNNGNFRKIYIDGKEVASSSGLVMRTGDGIGVIGKHASNGYYFDGQIDDVRIYNYALTPLQIKEVYNGGAVNYR
jgi:hypothetical protein